MQYFVIRMFITWACLSLRCQTFATTTRSTRSVYGGLPQDHPEEWKQSSPITFAGQLQGQLLVVHGTGDDNVHYQGTEAMIDKLIAANKQF